MAEPIYVYEEGTTEFHAIDVTLDGLPETSGVLFEITHATKKPTGTFNDRYNLQGDIGVMVGPSLAVGRYRVWCKITGQDPEIPKFKVWGMIQING